MALNLKYLIASRYVRSPKSHSVINIISGVSIVAMAVPVAAIVLLLSIFNGLERMTSDLYRAVDADLKVIPASGTTFLVESIDTAALTPEASLREDIGINSIGLLYMAMAVEEEFGIKFKNEDFAAIHTVADVIYCIESKC